VTLIGVKITKSRERFNFESRGNDPVSHSKYLLARLSLVTAVPGRADEAPGRVKRAPVDSRNISR
jgi:hypothetical protein